MEITTLTTNDIPQILKLESPDDPNYFKTTEEELEFVFNHPETCNAIGIFDKDKLIAWGMFWTGYQNKAEGEYEIFVVFVDKAYRGRGLGKQTLQELIHRIQTTQKYKEIYLVCSPHNIPALMLYLNNGFIISDFKKDYFGPGKDRVVLTYEGNKS